MELQERSRCVQKGLLGSYALLLQTPTDCSRLWDEALNSNGSSSHASPLRCPESAKGSYNPPLRPQASSPAALPAQTWAAACYRTGPFCKAISSARPAGTAVRRARHREATGTGAGWVGAGMGHGCVPRHSTALCQGQLPARSSPASFSPPASPQPFLSGPHAASSLPASLPLFEYIKLDKTSYRTRN